MSDVGFGGGETFLLCFSVAFGRTYRYEEDKSRQRLSDVED
jgi:hypothetical protein